MELTPNFSIPCPSPEDYAAMSIYMQRLAEKTEEEALALRNDLNSSLRPDMVTWRSVNDSATISNSGFAVLTLSPNGGDLIQSTYLMPDGRLPSSGGPFRQAGIYHYLWSVTLTPTGAVTANSDRRVASVIFKNSTDGRPIVARADDVRPETDAASGSTSLQGGILLVVDSDFANHVIELTFSHANAASTVRALAGDINIALLRVGSADIIEVI